MSPYFFTRNCSHGRNGSVINVFPVSLGRSLRKFVNGTLIATAGNVGPPAGQIAVATYEAAADFDDLLAYRP